MLRLNTDTDKVRRLIQAFNSLQFNTDWQLIRTWIDENISNLSGEFLENEVHNRWREGAIIVLKELMEQFDKAQDNLNSIKK